MVTTVEINQGDDLGMDRPSSFPGPTNSNGRLDNNRQTSTSRREPDLIDTEGVGVRRDSPTFESIADLQRTEPHTLRAHVNMAFM
jgi:hypothetical protein